MNKQELEKQTQLLIDSLLMRYKQIVDLGEKAFTNDGYYAMSSVDCPLCEHNTDLHGKESCRDCIANEERGHICYDFCDMAWKIDDEKTRDEALAWINDQIVKHAKIIVYDNNGKTFDRYTIFIGNAVFGMSLNPFSPQGFSQYDGERSQIKEGKHLGKRVSFASLSNEVQKAIKARVETND